MKKLILILGLAMLIPARASWAQVTAPNLFPSAAGGPTT